MPWVAGPRESTERNWIRQGVDCYLDRSATLEFCCHDVPRAKLAEVFDDLVDAELVVPKGKYDEKVSYGATETLDEIIRGRRLVAALLEQHCCIRVKRGAPTVGLGARRRP